MSKLDEDFKARFLAARPLRRSEVRIEHRGGGRWHLIAPVEMSKAVARFARLPSERTFELDEIGKRVWDACDGTTSVQMIIEDIATTYQINRREGEVSTVAFLNMLFRKRLIRWDVA